MKPETVDKLFIIYVIVGLCVITFLGTRLYYINNNSCDDDYTRKYNGLRIPSGTKVGALELAKDYDEYGHWVCANIRNMDYEKAISVCEHEVAHEIFAMECSEDMSKCLEVIKDKDENKLIMWKGEE